MGGVGRPEKEIPEDQLVEMLQDGWSRKDTAAELGITTPTLRRRIANLQKKEGQILQYRALQSLELTEIEAQILEAVTPEKIYTASLRDLVTAFKILKDKELVSEGRPNEIRGLVGYLMVLEKEEAAQKVSVGKTIDAEIVNRNPTPEEYSKAEKAADEEIKLEEEDILEEREFLSSPFQQREPLSNRDAGKPGDNASVGNVLFPLGDLPDL